MSIGAFICLIFVFVLFPCFLILCVLDEKKAKKRREEREKKYIDYFTDVLIKKMNEQLFVDSDDLVE